MTRVLALVLLAASVRASAQRGPIPSDAAANSAATARPFLELICPGHVSAKGCSLCPPETPFFDSSDTWELSAITSGHFLSVSSDDALVSGSGCEPHVDLMSGSYLFTRERSAWRKVSYRNAEKASDCKKLAGSDGRDRLICEADDMHQGVGDSFVYLLDPGEPLPAKTGNRLAIFFLLYDSLGTCTARADGSTVSGAIESVAFSPAIRPSSVRITVTARLGQAAIPQSVLQSCEMSNGTRRPQIATVVRRYRFLFNGREVVPDGRNPSMRNTDAVAPRTSYRAAE